jgi:hypothetical protein
MIDILPWNIQRNIINFGVKTELHKELKKEIEYFYKLSSIDNKNYRKFLRDCMRFNPLGNHEIYDWKWAVWMLKKIWRGECPWQYIDIDEDTILMVRYLIDCANLRKANVFKYGNSISYIFMRILLYYDWKLSELELMENGVFN